MSSRHETVERVLTANPAADLNQSHWRSYVAEQIVAALGEPSVEYGVRWKVGAPELYADRQQAESLIHAYPEWNGVLVTRTVQTGEWQEVDRG